MSNPREEIVQSLFSENERTRPTADSRMHVSVGDVACEAGGLIPDVKVAYETWGELNAEATNAILICHALSGDSHAIGWWSSLVGPGKPIDTEEYFVIGNNLLGGCQGTTGPSSLEKPGEFPIITVGDMVEVQHRLVRSLGIDKLYAVAGGSMGGMLCLEWTVRFPGEVYKAFVTASCAASNAMQIGFHETARQAILRDPNYYGGNYEPSTAPVQGLALARMLGHLTYLSADSFERKFARKLQDKETFDYDWGPEFQVESYLNYQADKFTSRFDANTFLRYSKAVDYYECSSLQGSKSEYLFACFNSDWLATPAQSRQLHGMAQSAGCKSEILEIDLPYGHDSFLLDGEIQGDAVRRFLSGNE